MNTNIVERFWKHVDKKEKENCWEWNGCKVAGGYGLFYIDGKMVVAHRFSYELNCGKIPDGLFVCHTCDNPPCCNPYHLFLGTKADNMQDSINKGRTIEKLSWDDVEEIRRRYIPWKVTQEFLAKEFNVSRRFVGKIIARQARKNKRNEISPKAGELRTYDLDRIADCHEWLAEKDAEILKLKAENEKMNETFSDIVKLAYDYNGYTTAKNLKELIDTLRIMAENREPLINGKLQSKNRMETR